MVLPYLDWHSVMSASISGHENKSDPEMRVQLLPWLAKLRAGDLIVVKKARSMILNSVSVFRFC